MYKDAEYYKDILKEMDIDEKLNMYYNLLIDYDIATDDEISLICYINGFKEETLNDILYVRSGYRYLTQICEDLQLDL